MHQRSLSYASLKLLAIHQNVDRQLLRLISETGIAAIAVRVLQSITLSVIWLTLYIGEEEKVGPVISQ